ncbi:Alg9-like mannosyltransferase family-domain-containing protein [Fimicolochytrium jonesii]|uniref:Alg9-like mannosyltransferase family-domain-containing protein n=1 Tax=Fimicolochytrium jonesii TaxID=1396493 RepID=UPI0022FE4DD6|nr:Alg9-like mannosyltransferase family-domain-containing protein [Fimicolochytrium jonesii]KAI8822870.1 Alg9-like mannosyltransferase family-domain-containing protein [Fimicolochytrium jonesii]
MQPTTSASGSGPASGSFAIAYSFSLVWRLAWALLCTGYIHPDEHFQSTEIMAGSVFKFVTDPPWEWRLTPPGPARSVLGPFLSVGIPFNVLKYVSRLIGMGRRDIGLWAFYAPRLTSFLVSLLLDYAVFKVCRVQNVPHRTALMLLSISHVTFVYMMRPFSNSWLGIIVAVIYMLVFANKNPGSLPRSAFIGALVALGLSTRVEAPAVLGPFCLAHLARLIHHQKPWMTVVNNILAIAAGFAAVGNIVILADSLYYGTMSLILREIPLSLRDLFSMQLSEVLDLRIRGQPTFTIVNLLLYNLDKENLTVHGIHPRWLHAAVNMPMLYGPLVACIPMALRKTERSKLWMLASFGSVASGLAFLSAAPHQEPRFVVPFLVPVVLLAAPHVANLRAGLAKWFWAVWIIINLVEGAFFGGMHQSGVVPSLIHLSQHEIEVAGHCVDSSTTRGIACAPNNATTATLENYETTIAFYKLFSPPWHLLALQADSISARNTRVIQLAGGPVSKVIAQTDNFALPVGCPKATAGGDLRTRDGALFAKSPNGVNERLLLVAPTYIHPAVADALKPSNRTLCPLWYTQGLPHIHFDDLDKQLGNWKGDVWRVGIWQVVLLE